MKDKTIEFFMDGLQALIERHRLESDITLAAVIGCLEIQKQVMISAAVIDDT